jgi:hypothetical protein
MENDVYGDLQHFIKSAGKGFYSDRNFEIEDLSDAEACTLGELLPATNISRLSIGSNRLSAKGIEQIGKALTTSLIDHLSINDSGWHNIHFEILLEYIPASQIKTIDAKYNKLTDTKCLVNILVQNTLEGIDLSYNRINAAGLRNLVAIFERARLNYLTVAGNRDRILDSNSGKEIECITAQNLHLVRAIIPGDHLAEINRYDR